jgi:predicted aspartyl protease
MAGEKNEWPGKWKVVASLKILALGLMVIVAGLIFLWQKRTAQIKQLEAPSGFAALINQTDGTILTIPYQETLYKHFGTTIIPQVMLPVKTISGYKNIAFLIDSGAVVSALPKTMAEELGAELSSLPRITIEGFAGQKTFAYKGEMIIKIGRTETTIPVVFSESPQASNILGRLGFFDQFNINFDAESKEISISHKQ